MAKTILVTGATDGIGTTTARVLAARGHHVVVHGRDAAKAAAVKASIEAATGRTAPDVVVGDLASLDAVKRIADELNGRAHGLDVVVLNAGVFAKTPSLTADGHELTNGVNHLAHFALTLRVLPTLMKSEQGRVIVVSSMAHARGRLDLDAFNDKRIRAGWEPYAAYAESKLMNVLFALELSRRLQQHGSTVTANSLHPGVVSTKLLREGFGMNGPYSLDDGAATSVFLADDPAVATTTGQYFARSHVQQPAAAGRDLAAAARLWEISARHAGVDF
jgi:NAD(P)-dependent dehydrogenase (short-subunit alcohol dehydrogenase family)